MPIALAVFRLITNSNLVGRWTGSSPAFALQNSADIDASLAISLPDAAAIANETTGHDMFAPGVNRWQRVAGRKRGDLLSLKSEEAIGHHKERLRFLARELHECGIDVRLRAGRNDLKPQADAARRDGYIGNVLHATGVIRIDQHVDHGRGGDDLVQ